MDVSLLGAFIGGVLALLSPCSAVLLTIALGILLLLSDGTTALQGQLATGEQVALEDWVRRASAGVPDGLVLAVVALVALVVALVLTVRRGRRRSLPGSLPRSAPEQRKTPAGSRHTRHPKVRIQSPNHRRSTPPVNGSRSGADICSSPSSIRRTAGAVRPARTCP